MKKEGLKRWGEIEMEDGIWEVEDERKKQNDDGKLDMKIEKKKMKIVVSNKED